MKYFLIVITNFLSQFLYSQSSTYDDAIFLRKQYNKTLKNISLENNVKELLKKYYPNSIIDKILLDGNPFLKDLFEDSQAGSLLDLPNFLKSTLGKFGDLDVTNLADGFAKFLVKRTKEELNVAFFSRFYDLITKEEYKDARILFPQTYATFVAISDQIYNFQLYINTLRESFEKDLSSLLDNLPTIIEDGRYNAFFTNHPDLKATCLSGIYIGKGLLNKEHIGDILAGFDLSILDDPNHKDLKASVQTLTLFSESLRSSQTDRYWITGDELKLLIDDPITLQIYFGLMYQKLKMSDIDFSAKKLTEFLEQNLLPPNKITSYNDFLKGFIRQASIVTKNISNISGKEKDKITFMDYYEVYNSSLDFVEYTQQVTELPGIKATITLSAKLPKYIQAARAGGNVALDISRRNYGSAIINAYTIYEFAFGGTKVQIDNSAKLAVPGSPEVILQTDRIALVTTPPTSDIDGVGGFLLKYGAFISAVAQADNSDEVAAAIEAAALPSGSSRIKRETLFNVSLNAYTGLFIGHESIKGIVNAKGLNSFGVTAPIGVAISLGHSFLFFGTGENGWQQNKNGWSTSLFVSLLDLGAIAAYRFEDNKTEQVPTIQLKHIFSPGAFISIGIPKTPLSFNFGGQVGPTLRKLSNPAIDISDKTYFRSSISLCVDIPLLNFYTKSK